jgi:hypothetical protein
LYIGKYNICTARIIRHFLIDKYVVPTGNKDKNIIYKKMGDLVGRSMNKEEKGEAKFGAEWLSLEAEWLNWELSG